MSEDLFLIGYETSDKLRLGLVLNGQAYALTDPELSLHQLLTQYSASEVVPQLLSLKGHAINPKVWGLPAARAPVWAAGITYEAIKESQDEKTPYSSIYINVYSAPRPELFFKSMPYDIVTGGEAVGIRSDSQCTLPGPELVALLNNRLEVIGFSIGNDMSSSDLQADNPLYLSQAKVYTGARILGRS
jgi:fumarylacetoacetate (FAA) hydrolase family protein